ncbi:MAG: MBL fold metallo-hydrolase [Candidatus Brocadiia bacterium]|nr:MBL fold metallo-hydrolase [Candidatus Brocadiia bacterium]
MRIQFLGAARTTTGSMHLLEVNGTRILLDCGLYQGRRKVAFERNRNLPFEPGSVDVCVLSHAHIDHSGNLPTLVRKGFRGPIYATPPTRDLCEIMLRDSAYLQERDVEYVNKRRARQRKNLFEPLYRQEDVPATLARFQRLRYETPQEVAPGVVVTFRDAGHLLGSALVSIDITENGTMRRLLFTGDMGRWGMPILRDPVVAADVDLLITESTYGNRVHPEQEDVKSSLVELCHKVAERSARLIIPAFSVGRTQQLLYLMHELWAEGRMCDIPVYVDSPLSTRATKVYDDHPECYDRETLQLIRRHEDPFSMDRTVCITDVADSKKLNTTAGPMIIISASGMCEGGRILHHLKNNVEDSRNIILFVGYQAEHTLGRRMVHKETPIKIFGDLYDLRAEVHSIQALSAHADRKELLRYFREMGPQVDRAFVVHGEPEQSEPFAEALRELGARDVAVPEPGWAADI